MGYRARFIDPVRQRNDRLREYELKIDDNSGYRSLAHSSITKAFEYFGEKIEHSIMNVIYLHPTRKCRSDYDTIIKAIRDLGILYIRRRPKKLNGKHDFFTLLFGYG